MFTLIQGDTRRRWTCWAARRATSSATFLQADVGGGDFQSEAYIRTRGASRSSGGVPRRLLPARRRDRLGVSLGLLAGTVQATHPRSPASRAIAFVTALALSSPVYWLGLMVLLLFAPGVGSVAEIPFLSTIGGYRGRRTTRSPSCTASGCRA